MNKALSIFGLLALVTLAAGCGDSDSSSPSSQASDAPAPAASALSGAGDPKDVTFTKCEVSSTLKAPQATLTVKNNSSKASTFLVTVAFNAADGSQVGTADAYVGKTDAGATSEATNANLLKRDVPTGFTCAVSKITVISL